MTTIASLAAEYDMQPYELAAYLDLGTDYTDMAELDERTEAEYRDILAAGDSIGGPDAKA